MGTTKSNKCKSNKCKTNISHWAKNQRNNLLTTFYCNIAENLVRKLQPIRGKFDFNFVTFISVA